MIYFILGAAIDFTEVSLPFDVVDLITSTMSLVKTFGPYLLLGVAIVFAPRLFVLARAALFGTHKDYFGNVYNKHGMPIKYAKGEKKRIREKYGDNY
jgi:predicted RND superfamily exporter protein